MRTYEEIYTDYCNWLVKTTGDDNLTYELLKDRHGEQEVNVLLHRQLFKRCTNKNIGMFFFVKFIVGGLEEIGYPYPVRYNTLFRKFDKLVNSYDRLAILAARGIGKSLYFSVLRILHDMFCKKFRRHIIISANQEQANRIIDDIKKIVDNNEWLKSKKGGQVDNWSMESITYNKGYVKARGLGTEILGEHVNSIVCDDILRSDNKLSDEQIEDYIDMNLSPMLLNRKGQLIVVGTTKSQSDIFAKIQQRIEEIPDCPWKLFRFPAIIDFEKKIVQCPDRFTFDEIIKKRLEMGPLKFAREYQLETYSRDKALFSQHVIRRALDKGNDAHILYKADKREGNWTFVAGVDTARSGAASADYSVMIVMAYNSVTQEKQIVYMWREKGMKISSQAERIAMIAKSFNDCFVLVEKNNMGQDMIDELVDTWNVNVESYITGGKGQKKEELIRFLITSFEHEQITIPNGDPESRAIMKPLVEELGKFCVTVSANGNEQYQGVGKDDTVMALALTNRATQLVGIPFAVSEFGSGKSFSEYDALVKNNSSGETDLVKMIRMGLIK